MPTCPTIENYITLLKEDPSKTLGLKVGKHNVTPGLFIPKTDAQSAPELIFTNNTTISASKIYVAVEIDLDAPFVSFPVLGPILHWVQPGYKSQSSTTATTSESQSILTTTQPVLVNYGPPGPPPPSGPHRYVFMLYEQPDGFAGGRFAPVQGDGAQAKSEVEVKIGIWPRVRFDFDGWVKEVGLGDVVALNWFTSK